MATVSSVTKHFITGQEGFTTTLASTISSGAATVPLNSVSGYTNGEQVAFVIEPTDASKKQVFTGTIDTSGVQVTGVVWTEGTNQTHNAGVTVVDYWTATHQAAMVKGIKVHADDDGTLKAGAVDVTAVLADSIVTRAKLDSVLTTELNTDWRVGVLPAQSGTITNNGNRSYDIPFASSVASILSPGMRLRTTRTVSASTQCADLEATSSQYFNDTTVSGITFTDDFTCGAWVKLESYAAMTVISRQSGTSGWALDINSSGQVRIYGWATGNGRQALSYQSLPLGKWVHIAGSMDLSGSSGLLYIDGVLVPSTLSNLGAGGSTLTQAGNLEVGSIAGGTVTFDGKLSNVFVSSSVVSAANIRILMTRDLAAADTTTYSLASAYTLSNSLTDLNTTSANNLTAQNSAVATNSDSPFANATGTPSGTTDVALVMEVSGSTAKVQVPEGCTIPTTGGVSAVAYSTSDNPFGWVADKGRWEVPCIIKTNIYQAAVTSTTTYNPGGMYLTKPAGKFAYSHDFCANLTGSTDVSKTIDYQLSTSNSAFVSGTNAQSQAHIYNVTDTQRLYASKNPFVLDETTQTTYYPLFVGSGGGTLTNLGFIGTTCPGSLVLTPTGI